MTRVTQVTHGVTVTGLPPHAFHGKHASLQAYVSHHYHGKHARRVVAGHVATHTHLLQS